MRPGATLAIRFNQDVTVSGDWVSLACTQSGQRRPGWGSLGVGGGPRHYRLAAEGRFVAGERCRLTIHRGWVAAKMGSGGSLGADYTVRFVMGRGGETVYLPLVRGGRG